MAVMMSLDLEPADAARIEFAEGDPLAADLGGVIAILCAGAGDIGIAMSLRAKAVGLPVNVMDDLTHSTFIFPAIVDRGDVVVAVGTGGASPVVARRVRERIEAMLPARIGDLATFIGRWRKPLHSRIAEIAAAPSLLGARDRWPDRRAGARRAQRRGRRSAEEYCRSVRFCRRAGAGKAEGRVTLVGAGPGDPDLLTIKALRALQDADVVFYDELVSPEILDRARRDASRVPVGRRVGKPGIGQDAINRLLIEAAKVGTARGAAQGRRSLRVRPRRRGSRSAARGRHCLFDRARHYRRARCCRAIRGAADLPARGAAHHLPHRAQGQGRRRPSTGRR